MGCWKATTLSVEKNPAVVYCEVKEDDLMQMLSANNDALTLFENHEQPIVFDKEVYNSGVGATGGHYISEGGPAPGMRTEHPPGVCSAGIVRRLTPLECERLDGYPSGWTDIGEWADSKGRKRQT